MFTEFTVGLKSDGTLIAVGNNDFNQTNVDSITNIKIPLKPTYSFTKISDDKKSSKAPKESNTVEKHVSLVEETKADIQDEKSHSYTPYEVLYLPGSEPEKIRQKIERLKIKLDAAYPEKNISRLHIDHKKWGETVTELYKSLGYPDGDSFLSAYGYTVTKLSGGRPTSDHMAIIEELKRRYPNGSGITTTTDLVAANPDLASRFSNLGNQALKFFGMPLGEYLYSQGILNINTNDQGKLPYEELKARYVGTPFDGTLTELKSMNRDVDWDDINRQHQQTNQAITLKNFLIDGGVMVSTKPSVDEKLDDVIAELKNRYSNGKPLPQSLDQLKVENSDLPLSQLNIWTELVYSEKANPFLIRNGLIEREKTSEEKHDLITSALKEKYGSDKSGANSIQIFIDGLTVDQQEFVAKFFSWLTGE